jgi:hypothetical protein
MFRCGPWVGHGRLDPRAQAAETTIRNEERSVFAVETVVPWIRVRPEPPRLGFNT